MTKEKQKQNQHFILRVLLLSEIESISAQSFSNHVQSYI